MKDPTRIPRVIDALRSAWEGQPDLSLPAFLGIIANRGIGWGSTDEELMDVLAGLEAVHPALIDAPSGQSVAITTTSPNHAVTLTRGTVVVRSADAARRIPGVWRYSSMRRTGPGLPLVIADMSGVEHRLGVVNLITRFDAACAPALPGLGREDVGSCRWLVQLEGGRRCVVGQRIRLWDVENRTVDASTVAWERIVSCRPGEDFIVLPVGGGTALSLGHVAAVDVLEV